MPVLEVELKEDGSIGKLPDVLQKFLDGKFSEAFGKGAAKAAEEAKGQIAEAVAKAKEEALKGGGDPAAVEKAKNLEVELSKHKEAEATREKNFQEAQRLRDERHANEIAEREKQLAATATLTKAEIEKRDAVIRSGIDKEIRIKAAEARTRNESLDEVGELLAKFITLDADFAPIVDAAAFVKKFPDSKLGADGKPVAIEGLVAEYLTLKPHHQAPVNGRGGPAGGGRSLSGAPLAGVEAEKAQAVEAITKNPSLANITAAMSQAGRTA